MLRIRPFAAIRPRDDVAERVASVPYDVVDTEEARALAQAEPLSFIRVVRSEVDLPEGTGAYDDAVYASARARLDAMLEEGVLQREQAPAVYLYRQQMQLLGQSVSQTGVVACCHVDDYRSGLIKKHELTRRAKEDDRTRHVLTLNANTGPVFLLHQDDAAIDAQVERDAAADPVYDFTAPDGVRHTVWKTRDPEPYVGAFGALPAAYVADGHHRSASAARAGAERGQAHAGHTGDEEYNWFLTVLFPASALTVLPYHRVVQGLGDHTADTLKAALAALGTLEPTDQPDPPAPGSFGVYLGGEWHRLTLAEDSIDRGDPVKSLDCALLGERVLGPLLGIGDVRTDPRMDFVGGIRGTAELEKLVQQGRADIAFAMHPTTVEQLVSVADAGEIMPPKSTWFEPKLRSGLLVHSLD